MTTKVIFFYYMTVNKENRTHLVTVLLGHFDLHCKKWKTLFLII